jgi:prophage regulatory protein
MSDRLLTWPELEPKIPYGRQHVGRLEKADRFPKRIQVGPGRVAWWESEVDAWLASRVRGAPPQRTQLGPKSRPAPEPDPEDLEVLRRLLAKFKLEIVPAKQRRREGRSPP